MVSLSVKVIAVIDAAFANETERIVVQKRLQFPDFKYKERDTFPENEYKLRLIFRLNLREWPASISHIELEL